MQPHSDGWSLPTSLGDVVEFAFHFNGNKQPIIHDYPIAIPLIAIPLYWILVFFGPRVMQNRKAFNLKGPLIIWNFLLTIVSIGMFFGMFIPVMSFLYNNGFYELVCMPKGELYYGFPFFCCWLFALSKYAELIDTVFLILRKRQLHFIHWYHHTTVLVYTWFCLVVMTPPGALFGVVNTFVHSIMYFYFFLTACGSRPSWAKLVTIIQIAQMAAGITISSFWTYYYLSGVDCPMDHPDAYMFSTLALYGSYFLLFFKFYLDRYGKKPETAPSKGQASKGQASKGQTAGKRSKTASPVNAKKPQKAD